jgi:hypothetical protein
MHLWRRDTNTRKAREVANTEKIKNSSTMYGSGANAVRVCARRPSPKGSVWNDVRTVIFGANGRIEANPFMI